MLYIVGLGLNKNQISIEALKALKESKKIYVENYTSKYSENNLKDLEFEYNIKFIPLYRENTELSFQNIIEESKKQNISFCVYGNITSATTHSTIINELKKQNIKYKLIAGISIFSVIPMLTGLEEYRFGRTISIVKPLENYSPDSFFDYILDNKKLGLHTICLLDIKIDEKQEYYMQPYEATKRLLEISKYKNINIDDWQVIIVSGACSKNEKIIINKIKEISNQITNYNYPSTIIVIGKLTMDEEESLKLI